MIAHTDDSALVAFLLREDAEAEAEAVSMHLLACATCTEKLDDLTRHEQWLSELRRTAHEPLQTRAALAAMAARGLVLQHFQGIDGEIITDFVAAATDIVVMHVPVPIGDGALEVYICTPDGMPFLRLPATLEADSPPEVLVCCHSVIARMSPGIRVKIERKTGAGSQLVVDARFVTRVA